MSQAAQVLRSNSTPFDALKTQEQDVDFAIDPSYYLTKKRYGWWSGGTRFDEANFSEVPGGIRVATGATADDTARIQSAIAGQYVSQTLAVPGQGLHLDPSVVSMSDGRASLTHGIVAIGAGWHNGTSGGWEVGSTVDTFLGFKLTPDGFFAVCISDGEHQAESPVAQPNWNQDPLDGSGDTGNVLDPSFGYIYNQPYTWYNEGSLIVGYIDPSDNTFWAAHSFEIDNEPSLDTPNLPTVLVLDNDGTAESLPVTLGGMQYSRYGGGIGQVDKRQTPVGRITAGGYISTAVTTNNNAVDPSAASGDPVLAIRRKGGERELNLQTRDLVIEMDNDIYLFAWDEWDYSAATSANSNFREPHAAQSSQETKVEVDTEVTSYRPQTAVFRGLVPISGGKEKERQLQNTKIAERVPIGATRVMTAVQRGSDANIIAMRQNIIESY